MIQRSFACVLSFSVAVILTGCGTYVPEIQEFPGNARDGEDLVHAIVASVHCEIKNAVTYVINQDKNVIAPLNGGIRSTKWFEDWGAQVALTLKVEEKSSLNPTAAWTPLNPAMFTLGGGAAASSDATRIDKLNYYYTVKQLLKPRPTSCPDPTKVPAGSLLIQSDLKLREWLVSEVLETGTGQIGIPANAKSILGQNALSHEVTFEVVTSGNITPAWKLVRVSVDQSTTLFSTSRDRTHDLLITFGPFDPAKGGLAEAAAASHLAAQIGLAINSRVGVLP